MKRLVLLSVGVLLLLVFAVFVWPTPYRYFQSAERQVLIVRMSRISQRVEFCTPGGWELASTGLQRDLDIAALQEALRPGVGPFADLPDPREFASDPAIRAAWARDTSRLQRLLRAK